MKKPPKDGFKQNDFVRFGGVRGVVITTSAPKEGYPLQVLLPETKTVFGFNANGEFHIQTKSGVSLVFPLEFVKRPKPSLFSKLKSLFTKSTTTAVIAPAEATNANEETPPVS